MLEHFKQLPAKPTIHKKLVSNQKLIKKSRELFSTTDGTENYSYSGKMPVYQVSKRESQVISYEKTTNTCDYLNFCNSAKYNFLTKQLYKNLYKFPVLATMLSEYPRAGLSDIEVV